MRIIYWITELIVVLTGINVSLNGLFRINLITDIFKTKDALFIAYIVIGAASVWMFVMAFNKRNQ